MSNYKTLDDVKRVISLGKSQSVIDKFWKSYQDGLQYQAWLEQMQADYDLLFPETEEVTTTDIDGNTVTETVVIDYSNNPDYLPFDEWMQVREVLTVTADVIDADGNTVQENHEYEGDLLREFVPDETLYKEMHQDLSNQSIIKRLAEIDQLSLRPLRAVANGTATQFDTDKLAQLDNEAEQLRARLL